MRYFIILYNHVTKFCDNGFVTTNLYDVGWNRTVKQSGGSMHPHVDSEHTAGRTATARSYPYSTKKPVALERRNRLTLSYYI